MRSREAVANWLLCATINAVDQGQLTFASTNDLVGGDGIIHDEASGEIFPTEHIMVPPQSGGPDADGQAQILTAINAKRNKGGAQYASGKTLVVFADADSGEWFPNRVARALPEPLYFEAVWVISLQKVDEGVYSYGVRF
jgi:hypothetical protein